MNPLFVLYMFSALDKNLELEKLDPIWEDKFVNMYNRYLLDRNVD